MSTSSATARLSRLLLAALATVAGAALSASPARADEISDTFANESRETTSEMGDSRFPTTAALCRAMVEASKKSLAAGLPGNLDEGFAPRTPKCFAETKPLPFVGSLAWKRLFVLHEDDGIATASRLAVETPSGFILLPVAWNVTDPTDPGCPSIVRDVAIDGAAVQNGHLVVVMAGERVTYVEPVSEDDPGAREELIRTPVWSTDTTGGATFRVSEPWLTGAALGYKIQPSGARDRWVPWAAIPWVEYRAFQIDKLGAPSVVVPPKKPG